MEMSDIAVASKYEKATEGKMMMMMMIGNDDDGDCNDEYGDRKPEHVVYDDPVGEDHHKQRESPKHCRRKYEVCELLELENFIHINLVLKHFALEKT